MCMSGQDRAVEREMQDILADPQRFQQAMLLSRQSEYEGLWRVLHDLANDRETELNVRRFRDLAKVIAYRQALQNIERVTRS